MKSNSLVRYVALVVLGVTLLAIICTYIAVWVVTGVV